MHFAERRSVDTVSTLTRFAAVAALAFLGQPDQAAAQEAPPPASGDDKSTESEAPAPTQEATEAPTEAPTEAATETGGSSGSIGLPWC